MKFSVHGPFSLPRTNRLIDNSAKSKKQFWDELTGRDPGISDACGCYVFVIKKNANAKPWYVGLTTRRSFKDEVLGLHQVNHYNQALAVAGRGQPEIYLLAKRTPKEKFARPSKNSHRDVEFLETFMFGVALNHNHLLRNSRNTKFLRKVTVPGVINTPQGAPTKAERSLKHALGL